MNFSKGMVWVVALWLGFAGAVGGCAYLGNKPTPLSESDERRLVEHVVGLLPKAPMRLLDGEKEMIARRPPTVRNHMYGYKQGRTTIRWSLHEGRILMVRGEGDLTSPENCSWEVSIVYTTKVDDTTGGKQVMTPAPQP